ncbi:thioredoxin fold domain-containing protein [Vibrio anguillarum]|uniref:thioredoxin fold domain-containing protein n=1 Tax=Vibrio TaxID=662 RepID=UPI0014837012|nr:MULTISPECIES: thioredoxin fold domain-containing protein [Vibrio]MCC4235198.1 thioredoxin fold domain-containing protein [Vibrio anguillarum]MDT3846249.1 thioredoxin fold domain-containing protein [Vibrio anguillarum]NNN69741.1 thiol:disulfide interchange protein [Vibrio sp. 3-2(1)]NOI05377.1 thioredoxin fold domain-containing protein [Vibrio anguillarum]
MSVLRQLTLLTLPLFAVACNAETTEQVTSTAVQAAALDKTVFEQRFSKLGLEVLSVQASDIQGVIEVQTSGGVLFSAPDASHFIAGTLYELDKNGGYVDVLAKRQAPVNAAKIAQFESSMIEYKAANEKYVVTVFTDITCGYCTRLHSQMKGYNDLGITVRYMAYPRQGVTGQVVDQMAAIWNADDKMAAMNEAKTNHQLPEAGQNIQQAKQLITKHYQLGRELGINGTPAIFLPNGEMVGGYLPPEQLLQRLQQIQ